jgi:hypothetical protein
MKNPVICYPRGSGGNWLGNLIWRLENNKFELSKVNVIFDGQTQSSSFEFSHRFNLFDYKTPTFDNNIINRPKINFSSPCWFNQYLNDAVKVRYYMLHNKIGEKSLTEQFHILTDSAIYIQTDPLWQQTWNTPGDLEYSLLCRDSDTFITQLFGILDQFNIKYIPNREYCHKSIEYYKSTCPNPADHLNNFNSVLWLAWCHADVLINNKSLPGTIMDDAILESIRLIVEPVSDHMLTKTMPITAEWKK